ncbi:endonuclease/exonuclease/phosphatase family protein [Microbaculum marinum]|uniref:Endonuclease/exonuclease/phosphatase family protein n=1 Tax=Microbaculum marinum TaxID=1764581 RepID=A0AAW9RH20_9HYPH
MRLLRPGLLGVIALPALFAAGMSAADAAGTRLTVMSFNIYGGGANEGKPVDETVAAIRAVGADIIAVQETRLEGHPCTADVCPAGGPSVTQAIAAALRYHYYEQTAENSALWANAVISRFPIVGATPNDLGVAINVYGRTVYAFNLHLDDSPYQPYQLLRIRYGKWPFITTEREAIHYARLARGEAVKLWKQDLTSARGAAAAFVFGDFNEPSHRDWTQAAADIGRHPIRVRYPTTRAIERKGFIDAYRAVWPDEIAKPAFTWTPTTSPDDPDDHHDRIDFVFVRGAGLKVKSAAIVGEKAPEADIVVTPWPSDHRAVAATVRFGSRPPIGRR